MSRQRTRFACLAAAATAAALSLVAPQSADANRQPSQSSDTLAAQKSPAVAGASARDRKGYYDARSPYSATTASIWAAHRPGGANLAALRAKVGSGASVTIDPLTGTPSNLTSYTDFLTKPSSASAQSVALAYVSANAHILGLKKSDLSTFKLRRDYVDIAGIHHISWVQRAGGVQVFGNGLKANVTRRGELISIQGSPVSGLHALVEGASKSSAISAAGARALAAHDVGGSVATASVLPAKSPGTTKWSNNDQAKQVWFLTSSGLRLGWSTYTQAGGTLNYSHVIDASTGRVLYRADLTHFDHGDSQSYDYYPGAPIGGSPRVVNFIKNGWLAKKATWLNGKNVAAWADLNDNNLVDKGETTKVPGTAHGSQFKLVHMGGNPNCSKQFVCTWKANKPFSWRTNKNADVANAFFLANKFHDHLLNSPVGFTAAAGNFERVDGDPVALNALDGANTDHGLPDFDHIDNANMSTPPDGIPPTMQMYLWHAPHTPNAFEPFIPVSGAFDASILYHEYTHGLSNRLVTHPDGNEALDSIEAGSMGEAWSDFYAMDFLVKTGFQPDSPTKDGQVREGKYTLADKIPFRTMAIDCPVGTKAANCTREDGTRGGYTYGDFPTIDVGGPEVHASGEVWAQTLWDIREALGSAKTEMLVTRGMELSPPEPSMLDMRNAIIQADKVVYGSANSRQLWSIFANRGMGWFAGAENGDDAFPAEDFHTPPSPLRESGIFGLVVDPITGDRIANATVTIAGHPEYSSTTGANGVYDIENVRVGTYPKIVATAPGYEIVSKSGHVSLSGTRQDYDLRRDWAASNGGASVSDFSGPDYSPQCGPEGAINLAQGLGWGSTTGDDAGTPTDVPIPKFVEIALPNAIDIAKGTDPDFGTAFRVDPSNTCGDGVSASTNEFRIQVSTDGTTWTKVADGAFGVYTDPDSRGHYFDVKSSKNVANVNFVRFWMDSPQVPDIHTNCNPDPLNQGCVFMDMSEIEVFGTLPPCGASQTPGRLCARE